MLVKSEFDRWQGEPGPKLRADRHSIPPRSGTGARLSGRAVLAWNGEGCGIRAPITKGGPNRKSHVGGENVQGS